MRTRIAPLAILLSVMFVLLAGVAAPANAATPIWTLSDAQTAATNTANPSSANARASAKARTKADAAIKKRISKIVGKGGLGAASSVRVVDVASGKVVYSRKSTKVRTVASNVKLLTATAALEALGPKTRFTTSIKQVGDKGVVHFVSGGDPLISDANLRSLAKQTAVKLQADSRTRPKIKVRLDDSLFTGASIEPSWRQGGYGIYTIQPIRATARLGYRSTDSAASAAKAFTRYLRAQLPATVKVLYRGRSAVSPAAAPIATVKSWTVQSLVDRMLQYSDNQVAEVLHRHIAISQGRPATFQGGAKATQKVLRKLGIPTAGITIKDGSGLSPKSKISAKFLTRLLSVASNPAKTRLRSILYSTTSLPIAGQTGTLLTAYGRFSTKVARCAVGKVVAKTGNLDYEIALSGYAVGKDNRLKAFSVSVNSVSGKTKDRARRTMDQVAASVSGACY